MTLSDTLELARWIGQAGGLLEGMAIDAPPHVRQAVAELLAATPQIPAAPPPDLSALASQLHAAAKHMDWQQVVMNGGPPCFHLQEDGRFCGRAKRWAGHDYHHRFVSLADILSRLTPAAGVDALYPDNLNADLAHRLSCVAHDCCVNGRMRHDVGLKLVRVVRDFMRPVHSPAAPEAAAERVYEWQGRRCVIRPSVAMPPKVWIGDNARESWSQCALTPAGEWTDIIDGDFTKEHFWPTRQSAIAFLENLTKGTT